MERVNEHIFWQMRKYGYNKDRKNGVQYADKQYQFLEWLQDMYDQKHLTGNFHSDNIIREIWNKAKRLPEPLQTIEQGGNDLYDSIMIEISGDNYIKPSCQNTETEVN